MSQQPRFTPQPSIDGLRIATWNMNGGYTADLSAPMSSMELATPIKEAAPDILGLVEVPFVEGQPSPAIQSALQNEGLETIGLRRFSESHVPESEELGMLLAVRTELASISGQFRYASLGRIEPRGKCSMQPHPKGLIAITLTPLEGQPVTVALTHLPPFHRFGWNEDTSQNAAILKQQQGLVAAAKSLSTDRQPMKLILMGDFNLKSRKPISTELGLKPLFEGQVTKTTSKRSADDILIGVADSPSEQSLIPTMSDHRLLVTRVALHTNESAMRSLLQQALKAGLCGVDEEGCLDHPNGFRRLTFKPIGVDRSILMLHFWGADTRTPDAHTHRWNYESFVLKGRLRLEQLEESDYGRHQNTFKYRHTLASEALTSNPVWRQLGHARLRVTDQQEVGAGSWYSGSWNRIHRVTCLSKEAITFFRHTERRTTQTSVFAVAPKKLHAGPVPRLEESAIRKLMLETERQLHTWA